MTQQQISGARTYVVKTGGGFQKPDEEHEVTASYVRPESNGTVLFSTDPSQPYRGVVGYFSNVKSITEKVR